MSVNEHRFKDSLAPLSEDIHLLGDLLGQVICEQHGPGAFELEEEVRRAAIARRNGEAAAQQRVVGAIEGASLEQKRILIKAFSSYFQLVNLAEDQQRVRVLRQRERQGAVSESIADAIATLSQDGWSGQQILELIGRIKIDLVLTAHPTEAKRQDFLIKLRDLAGHIDERDRLDLSPREQASIRRGILAGIEEMWQTSITRSKKPSVLDEVEFGLYFVTHAIMPTVVGLHRELIRCIQPLLDAEIHELPDFLGFSSWIGGDRDGHPEVTSQVTEAAVDLMRAAAKSFYLERLANLRDRLTHTLDEIQPSQQLLDWLPADNPMAAKFPEQPYRQVIDLVAQKLASDGYQVARHLLEDLRMVEGSLRDHGGLHTTKDELWDLIQMVRIFGLHLLPLDLRQDARRMLQAVDEIFKAQSIHPDYLGLNEQERRRILLELLNSPSTPTLARSEFSEGTSIILGDLATAARLMDRFGCRTFKCLIASMSRRASDVLAMQWLARLTGLENQVDLVPLFETLADLDRAPTEMEFLLSAACYRQQLERRKDCQQIMIGYSDSAKDGGYLAANWSLFKAQQELAAVVQQHGLCLRLFHGRGGSIGRGGGPTNRAIQTQPSQSMRSGLIRMTEQGEVIAYRYSRREIADRHLQQVVHATILAAGLPQVEPPRKEWRQTMDLLADYGRQAFQELVYEGQGFLDYWSQITPFQELEELPIGSRPARRSRGGFESVRAIPWVFSWMQCRIILPSWFGIGSAIDRISEHDEAAPALLRDMYRQWPLFKLLVENVELDLAKVELGIAEHYSRLIDDEELRQKYNRQIWQEYESTKQWLLKITERDALLDWMPVIQHSIERRNPYVDPLNFIQVSLLEELRQLPGDSPRRMPVLDAALSTINGVAAGMKNTG